MTTLDRFGEERLATLRQRAGLPDVRHSAVASEVRDPRAATQNLAYISPGHAMHTEWDAETAIRWAFYANVIVYRCCQIRANTVASLPFLAGVATPPRPGMAGLVSEGARLQQLLGPPPGGPAPKLSARRLWAWTLVQRIVTGRYGWEVETDDAGQIVALWPLSSAALRAVPTTGGSDWFSKFEYGPNHAPRILQGDEIIYGWRPSMSDFRQPESELQAARFDISIAVMSDRYAYAFLKNDARPAAVVVTEQFADDDTFNAFKSQFRGEYGGPDNAGKTAFVEASEGDATKAIDIKVLGLSQKDAQFMQQHVASLQRIAIALGVPWSKLDASGRTFDNATEEDHSWWESTMLPDLADLADDINMQLAPRLGREVGWFDTSGVRALQAPKQVTAVGAPSLLTSMLTTYNEARMLVGLEPIDGGDRFPTPEELAILKGTPQLEPVVAEVPELEPPDDDDETVPERTAPTSRESRDVETRDAEDPEVRRTKIWTATDAIARSLERSWERAMKRLFARQLTSTLARLEGKRGRQALRDGEVRAPGDVFDPEFWRGETAELTGDLYEAVLAAGAARVGDRFGVDFDLEAEWAQAFVRNRANQLAGQVTDTTYSSITDALAAGVEAGDDVPALAERVRHVFDVASTSRATTIARTEVISAFNASATLTAAQLPADVVGGREWIATRDARTRGEHADADGQVTTMDAGFNVGGEVLEYPGDPNGSAENTVNCRCTVAFLTGDEMAERAATVERRAKVAALAPILAAVAGRGHVDELALRRAYREAAA